MRAKLLFVIAVIAVLLATKYTVRAQIPGESWTRLGLLAGNVTAIGVSPAYNSDQTVYVGLSGSGLWRSSDRGSTWDHLDSVPNTATVTAIAFDPGYKYRSGNGQSVYVGTNAGYAYASTDDFASVSYQHLFSNRAGTAASPVTSMACPVTGAFEAWIFVGTTGGGVFYSNSFGAGWTQSTTSTTLDDCRTLAAGPTGQIWAACYTAKTSPVFLFTGPGEWQSRGPSGWTGVVPTALHVSSANYLDVWLGTGYGANSHTFGLWRSTNGASTWTGGCDAGNPVTGIYATYPIGAIAACPNFASDSEVWVGRSDGLKISRDGGVTCGANTPAGSVTAIAFSPGYHLGGDCDAFVGTTSGLFLKSCTPAVPPSNATPPAVSVNALAVGRYAYPGAWAASPALGLLRNSDQANRLSFLQYNEHATFGAGTPNIVAVRVAPGFDTAGDCGGNRQTVFVAEHERGVFRSTDDGNSWEQLSPGWPSYKVNDIAISPAYAPGGSDETIYAATSGGLYRWDGSYWIWVGTNTEIHFNETHVAVPLTYKKSATGTPGAPWHFVVVSVDDPAYPTSKGLYYSDNDGATLQRLPYNPELGDVTAITFSRYFGISGYDWFIFVSRPTSGVMVSNDAQNPINAKATWCDMSTGLGSSYVRDIETSPVYASSSTLELLAATDVGPYFCRFARASDPARSCSLDYRWYPSTVTSPPPGCMDTLAVTYGYKGDGTIAAAGMAEDGVLISTTSGHSYPDRGEGYHSLPDDVWTTVPYARDHSYLFATSPTYGVFLSTDQGASFHPYNGPGCTPLNDGAKGFANGMGRKVDSSWTWDYLYAGATTACGGIQYRKFHGLDSAATPVYPSSLDAYRWSPSNQYTQAFQKIVNLLLRHRYS